MNSRTDAGSVLLSVLSLALAMAIVMVTVTVFSLPAVAEGADEHLDFFFTLVDDSGKEITSTGLQVFVGDEFISMDNRHYRVVKVEGNRAQVKDQGPVDLSLEREAVRRAARPGLWARVLALLGVQGQQVQGRGGKVAIYHTHSDESYEPTDGSGSIRANGGIFKVGDALTRSLEANGMEVLHDQTPHDPHDSHAYHRSRRTAMRLLERVEPDVMIDVHRDTTPAEAYLQKVSGKTVAQAMLVVGRQNPKMQENLAFAKRIKAAADQKHPGLIRGIFFARGDYNQDLFRRNILVEIGSHNNVRLDAEQGAEFLGDVLPAVIGTGAGERGASWTVLFWGIILSIVGLGAYLFLSTGSLEEARAKVSRWFGPEFLGSRRRGGGNQGGGTGGGGTGGTG